MEKYIGTKIVQAEPACCYWMPDGEKLIVARDEDEPQRVKDAVACEIGYKVRYEDGYESWSPKELFKRTYRRTDGMSFGLAVEAAKMGRKITRAGWNGKGQYVELGVDIDYYDLCGNLHGAHHADIGSKALVFVGTRGRQMGWLASQSDMLADDWMIVE